MAPRGDADASPRERLPGSLAQRPWLEGGVSVALGGGFGTPNKYCAEAMLGAAARHTKPKTIAINLVFIVHSPGLRAEPAGRTHRLEPCRAPASGMLN